MDRVWPPYRAYVTDDGNNVVLQDVYHNIGYGKVINQSDRAFSWRANLKGEYRFDNFEKLELALVGDIGMAGHKPIDGKSEGFSFIGLGTEFGYPVNWFPSDDDQTMLYGHVLFNDFLDDVEFGSDIGRVDSLGNFWQVGLALGRRNEPLKFWFLRFDRVGVALKFSTQDELRGIRFITRSIFEL